MLLVKVHSEHGEEMYINADRIVSISKSGGGSCIRVITDTGNCEDHYVSEAPNTIVERAWQNFQQNPPIIACMVGEKHCEG